MKRGAVPTYVSLRKPRPTPWVALNDLAAFLAFCAHNGVEVKSCVDGESGGYYVRSRGGWGHLLWNQVSERYSADRRLAKLIQKFALDRTQEIKEVA